MSKGLSVVVCNLYSSNTTTRQNISHSIPQIICYIVVLKVLIHIMYNIKLRFS